MQVWRGGSWGPVWRKEGGWVIVGCGWGGRSKGKVRQLRRPCHPRSGATLYPLSLSLLNFLLGRVLLCPRWMWWALSQMECIISPLTRPTMHSARRVAVFLTLFRLLRQLELPMYVTIFKPGGIKLTFQISWVWHAEAELGMMGLCLEEAIYGWSKKWPVKTISTKATSFWLWAVARASSQMVQLSNLIRTDLLFHGLDNNVITYSN